MRRSPASDRKKPASRFSRTFKIASVTVGATIMMPVPAMTQTTARTENYATLAQAQQAGSQETIIRVKAANCVNITESDLARTPAIKPVFDRIASQTMTGAPVIARLRDPAHRFQICLDPSLPGNGVLAAYMSTQNRLFVPVLGADFESVAHESYHAYQDTLGGIVSTDAGLHPRDMAMSLLLTEASAVGYTLMLMREIGYSEPEAYAAFIADNKNSFGMGQRFDAAYNTAYAANENMEETARRSLALEAGGSAVVEALLSGVARGWSAPYANNAARMAQLGDANVDTSRRQYRETRDELFRRAGRVGSMNIVPARFIGPNADAYIASGVDATGIEIVRVPAPEFSVRRPRS